MNRLDEIIVQDRSPQKRAYGITPSSQISQQVIERMAPTDLAGTVNQLSGIYLLSGALNTNRITVRGIGARTLFGTDKLRMYFNGIPITDGSGFSTLEAFDLVAGEPEVAQEAG